MLGKNPGFKAVSQGVGIAAGIGAMNLLGGAIGGVTGFLGDSIAAYNEEQKSVAQLDAALKANVAGYNGNRDAIEKVLTARMALGFSDEEQRASLAHLVAATHDSNKALDIQRTAMDLARFKGISLADATDALTKVEAGSFRVLKSLGIELKAGATQTEALAAVQRVATGQAEAYANTNEGKVLASQIKVNEAEEKFGKALSKLEAEVLPAVATAIGAVADAFDSLGIGAEKSMAEVEKAVAGGNLEAQAQLNSMRATAAEAADKMELELRARQGPIGDAAAGIGAAIVEPIDKSVHIAKKEVQYLPNALAGHLRDGWDNVHNAAVALGDAIKKPIKAAVREKELQDILDGKGSVGHKLARGLKSADPLVREAAKELRTTIFHELDAIRGFTMTLSAQTTYTGGHGGGVSRPHPPTSSGGSAGGGRRAAGGPVSAGSAYVVGEEGEEVFVPDSNGRIIPHGSGSPVSTGHPHVIQLVVSRRVLAQVMADEDGYGRNNPTFQPA